jgi:hypothetical protein
VANFDRAMKFPEDFNQSRIDLEFDLGSNGGLQRFKTVGEVQKWLDEEKEFWRWMNEGPASNHHSAVSDLISDFKRFQQNARNPIQRAEQKWQERRPTITEQSTILADKSNSDETRKQARERIDQQSAELESALQELTTQLRSTITTEILNSKSYLSRFDPAAHFVNEIAEKDPSEALFALDQILLEMKQSSDRRRVELSGRMFATFYTRNLNKKARHDQQAFEKAILTWAEELRDFKSRYEEQEQEFNGITERHATAEMSWTTRSDKMAEEFAAMRKQKEEDLANLKETYETDMQLKGPLVYWRGKRREHAKGKIRMGWAAAVVGIVGALIIAGSAYLFLPVAGTPDSIPWRSIGFFVLISTFVLWLARLCVKLMLSHIHLYADAREREVMISTFMALVRRQESREGLSKADIALVLAPIFKPSTTGVIKDDGGPTTLTDFLGRLTGK